MGAVLAMPPSGATLAAHALGAGTAREIFQPSSHGLNRNVARRGPRQAQPAASRPSWPRPTGPRDGHAGDSGSSPRRAHRGDQRMARPPMLHAGQQGRQRRCHLGAWAAVGSPWACPAAGGPLVHGGEGPGGDGGGDTGSASRQSGPGRLSPRDDRGRVPGDGDPEADLDKGPACGAPDALCRVHGDLFGVAARPQHRRAARCLTTEPGLVLFGESERDVRVHGLVDGRCCSSECL